MVDSKYQILSNLRNCDFGKYSLLEVTNAIASRARIELEMGKEDQGLVSQKGATAGMNQGRPIVPEDTLCRPNKTHLCTISRQWCQ